jgi:hypothetical protein
LDGGLQVEAHFQLDRQRVLHYDGSHSTGLLALWTLVHDTLVRGWLTDV